MNLGRARAIGLLPLFAWGEHLIPLRMGGQERPSGTAYCVGTVDLKCRASRRTNFCLDQRPPQLGSLESEVVEWNTAEFHSLTFATEPDWRSERDRIWHKGTQEELLEGRQHAKES